MLEEISDLYEDCSGVEKDNQAALERWRKKWKKIYDQKFISDTLKVLPIKDFERKKNLAM